MPIIRPDRTVDFLDENVVCIDCRPDGTWHEYAFDLSGNKGWTGNVDELWLGVEDLMHAVVDIDWMRFESAVPPTVVQMGIGMTAKAENVAWMRSIKPTCLTDAISILFFITR